jgi:hypothetical protein
MKHVIIGIIRIFGSAKRKALAFYYFLHLAAAVGDIKKLILSKHILNISVVAVKLGLIVYRIKDKKTGKNKLNKDNERDYRGLFQIRPEIQQ